MWRLYLVPMEIVPRGTTGTVRRAKYMDSLGVSYGTLDYGRTDVALVAADVDTTQHTTLAANADVYAFPANLDREIGDARVDNVREALEVVKLPGGWVDGSTTAREIARAVAGVLTFGQKHNAMWSEELIPNRAALSLDWGDVAQDRRDRIVATGAALGYDLSGIASTVKVRAILRNLIFAWGARDFVIHSLTF